MGRQTARAHDAVRELLTVLAGSALLVAGAALVVATSIGAS